MTDTRKEFQEWYIDQIWGNECFEDGLRLSWQACQQLNDKRIADLLAVVAKKDEALKYYADGEHIRHLSNGECVFEYGDIAKEALFLTVGDLELVEVAHLKFRAVLYGGNHENGPESHEWLETCNAGDVGDDKQLAFPVYTIKEKSINKLRVNADKEQ